MGQIWIGNGYDEYEVGQVGFLMRNTDTAHRNGWVRFDLLDQPGRTNMSRAHRLHGWLGTTNDICADALGVAKVVRVTPNDRAQVVILSGAAEAEALEALGWPDLG